MPDYCANVAAARCPNDDVAGCPVGCQVIGNFITACNGLLETSTSTCGLTATFACGADGKAGAPACLLEFAAYAFCTLGGAVRRAVEQARADRGSADASKRQRSAEVEGLDGSRLVARVTGGGRRGSRCWPVRRSKLFGQVANAEVGYRSAG